MTVRPLTAATVARLLLVPGRVSRWQVTRP